MAIKPAAGRANGRDGSLGFNARVNEGNQNAGPFSGKMKTLGWFADLTECSKNVACVRHGLQSSEASEGNINEWKPQQLRRMPSSTDATLRGIVAHGGFPNAE
jgi:hypothetical protein